MNPKRFFCTLREKAITAAIILALLIAIPLYFPGLRSRIGPALNPVATLQVIEEDWAETQEAAPSGGNTFKKVVSAPVRFFARLFKGKGKEEDRSQIVSKPTAKQIESFRVAPVTRIRNGGEEEAEETAGTDLAATAMAERAAAVAFDQGIAFRERGQLNAAVEKFISAAALRPNFAEAYNMLGVCYDEKGMYEAAQKEYKKALRLEPYNARFLNNLGYSYYLAGRYKDAIKWYQKALKLTPTDRRLHNNLGLAYGRKGDYVRALEHFTVAVGETAAHLNLGYVYSQQNRFEEAIWHYEIALRAQPQSLTALSNLAQLYERVGRVREALLLGEQYKKLSLTREARDQTAEHKE
jgi:Flp pilus assembly protein TadD